MELSLTQSEMLTILRENSRQKALLEAMFDANPAALAVLEGPDLIFSYVNPAYRFLIPDLADPLGKPYRQVWPIDHRKIDPARIRQVLETGQPYQVTDVQFDFPDDTTRFYTLQTRRFEWEEEHAVLMVLWDTTEIHRAERAVRSIALFPEENPNPVIRLSRTGLILYLNLACKNRFRNLKVGNLAPDYWDEHLERAYRTGEPQVADMQIEGKWYAFDIIPVTEVGYINLYGRDITERKQMEEKLLEHEKKYQQIFKTTQAAIYEVDLKKRRIISANDAMVELGGYSREELLGMNPFDLLDEEGKAMLQQRTIQWLTGEKPSPIAEYKIRAKDGRIIYGLLNVTLLTDENGIPDRVMVIGYDITDQKAREDRKEK